jgi:TRAP-type mannitol/chloroaromatic compound transport system permease small subunit
VLHKEFKIENDSKGILGTLYDYIKKAKNVLYLTESYTIKKNDVVRVHISYLPLSYAAMGSNHILNSV